MKDLFALAVAFAVATVAMPQELALENVAPGTYAVLSPAGHLAAANAGLVLLEDAVLVIDTHRVPSAARESSSKPANFARLVYETSWSMSCVSASTCSETTRGDGQRFPALSGTRLSEKGNCRRTISQ